jgi:hypothetical protein
VLDSGTRANVVGFRVARTLTLRHSESAISFWSCSCRVAQHHRRRKAKHSHGAECVARSGNLCTLVPHFAIVWDRRCHLGCLRRRVVAAPRRLIPPVETPDSLWPFCDSVEVRFVIPSSY